MGCQGCRNTKNGWLYPIFLVAQNKSEDRNKQLNVDENIYCVPASKMIRQEKMLCEFKPLGKCETIRFWVADHLVCLIGWEQNEELSCSFLIFPTIYNNEGRGDGVQAGTAGLASRLFPRAQAQSLPSAQRTAVLKLLATAPCVRAQIQSVP